MLDAIKHITDDNFFFQEVSAQVHCVCNTIQLSEKCDSRVSPFCQVMQKWEAQVIWGGIVKRLLIACFIGNISAKKCQNPLVRQSYSKLKVGRFFETPCTISQHWDALSLKGQELYALATYHWHASTPVGVHHWRSGGRGCIISVINMRVLVFIAVLFGMPLSRYMIYPSQLTWSHLYIYVNLIRHSTSLSTSHQSPCFDW